MNRVVADIETDGLLPELTKVHALVIKDLDSDEMLSCADQDGYTPIPEGLDVLAQADRVYFHNGINFDVPALKKVYLEWEPEGEILDTMILAQLRFAHIEDRDFPANRRGDFPGRLIGSHSLEAWGYRLGVWKGDYQGGWDEWTPAMQEYCEQDVVVTEALIQRLAKAGLPARAVEIEHALARYLRQQEENGWPFDVGKAAKLQAKLAARRQEIEDDLRERVGWWYGSKGQTNPKQSFTRRKNFDVPRHYFEGAPYTRLKKVEFNPASRQHIARVLQEEYGWEPSVFTPNSGEPKVSEEILKGLDYDIAEDLVEYLTINKRLGQLAEGQHAWLRHVEEHPDLGVNVIRHRCYQKPRTHRQAHSSPNLAQVPANDAPWGEECRELFHAPDGWTMLGTDVSGLELRTVGHYMAAWDGGAYGREVIEGDVHTRNQEAVGAETRGDAKVFIYAYLYGAGNEKLGKAIAPAGLSSREYKKIGGRARKKIESKFPALGYLSKAVKRRVQDKGYLRLIDGRRAYPRSNYAALNTLIQGTGAIVCKAWLLELARRLEDAYGPQGWDGKWAALGFIHDELQLAVKPEIAEDAGRMSVEAIKAVAEDFDFKVPLDADYDIGPNWSKTH